MADLKDKVVLVTGASSGIGKEICLDLVKAGCKIIAAAHRVDRLNSLCSNINSFGSTGTQATAPELDVASVQPPFEKRLRKLGKYLAYLQSDILLRAYHNHLFPQVVKLAECEIYVYNPNPNADPFLEEGAINLAYDAFLSDTPPYGEDDEEIFEDMDM